VRHEAEIERDGHGVSPDCTITLVSVRVRSPLASWFAGRASLEAFRRRTLGRRAVVRAPRDGAWRAIAPDFAGAVALVRAGAPFQTALERRYDRSGDPRRLGAALRDGTTVYLPQVHQVLPRVMRLIVAVRAALLGPFREEASFLFLVEGRGRPGMGLHHDGEVDAFWLQLEGRRTVTLGPPVPPRTPQDLDERRQPRGRRAGWRTIDLRPGSLLYLPPRTPHEVVCHGRSLALSLTWTPPRRHAPPGSRAHAMALAAWDVASGRAHPRPRRARRWLWTQAPAVAGRARRERFPLWTADGELWMPVAARPLAARLSTMPAVEGAPRAAATLLAHGLLGPEDLPLTIVPDAPTGLDGWRFA
jgi:mannose-6-phosphate isomerase-like protein (cupin superfamily)